MKAGQSRIKKSQIVVKPPQSIYSHNTHKSPRIVPKMPPLQFQTQNQSVSPPEDTGPAMFSGPVKPSFVLLNFVGFLTQEETIEINQYPEIYYIRDKKPQQPRHRFINSSNFFPFVGNDHIAYRYEQLQVLGKGSFGSVIKCFDHKTNQMVAIKMMKDIPKEHSQLLFELEIMEAVQPHPSAPKAKKSNNRTPRKIRQPIEINLSHNHIIKLIDSFQFRGFFCIVMELMGPDLYFVLKSQHFVGFDTNSLRIVASQTADALNYIHSQGIIHCDIKPENILFANPETTQFKNEIRVIDFGCSCYDGKLLFSYIQSRYYRAPEVVLGCEYSTPIDIWSLGCVLCELVTGKPLFPAEDEDELIHMIAAVLGMPDRELLKNAPRAHHYFDKHGNFLDDDDNYYGEEDEEENSETNSDDDSITEKSTNLIKPGSSSIQKETKIQDTDLLDLISSCLRWNPLKRLTAAQIMKHPWILKSSVHQPHVPCSSRI